MAQSSAEKLEHTGPAEKERVASECHRATERAVGKYARAALAKRKNEQCRLSRVLNHEGGERVKVGESRILLRERGIRAGA